MIKNQQHIYYTLNILFIVLTLLAILLVSEWYRVRNFACELLKIKEDYKGYVRLLQDQLSKKTGCQEDACINSYNQCITLNRNFGYLCDSALEFGQDELGEIEPVTVSPLYEIYNQSKKDTGESVLPGKNPVKAEVKKPVRKKNKSMLSWPIEKGAFWLSSPFGPRKKADGSLGFHQGIDLAAIKGTQVRSAAAGLIIEAKGNPGYGNTIVIMHNKKYKTRYAHLDKILVKCKQKVDRGQIIGTVGNTGLVRSSSGGDGSHLHFEVSIFGKKINPRNFLP